jgi:hypothetical protein
MHFHLPEALTADSRLLPSRHVRATITGQGGMLLDLRGRRGRWYALTPAACVWWQRIQDGCTTGQASQAVADRYGIPAGQAAADLAPFVETLLRKRMLTPVRQQHKQEGKLPR